MPNFMGAMDRDACVCQLLSNQPIIFGMRGDPKPQQPLFDFDRERPMTETNPHRPIVPGLLEAQRGMLGVLLQQGIVSVGQIANML
jgi:hypothetical protein